MENLLKFLFVWIFVFTTTFIYAQAPEGFNYQAVIRDGSGNPVTSGNVSLKFTVGNLLAGALQATYIETHSLTPNNFGLVTTVIGEGTVVSGTFSSIDWSSDQYFLQVEADPNGGTNYIDMGTTKFMSVPYALSAANVDDADADPANELQNLSLSGSSLSISNGNSVTLSADDADADPSNELQNLSRSGNTLSISNGNSVSLPSSPWSTSGNDTYRSSGEVGVGISNPQEKLHIRSVGADAHILVQGGNANGTSGYSGIKLYEAQSNFGWMITNNSANSILDIWHVNSNMPSSLFRFNDGGAAFKLGGGSWTGLSDKRLKDRVVDYKDGLAELVKIRPVRYHYTKESGLNTDNEYVGVIAQELKEVAPYMVSPYHEGPEGDKYLSVDNSAMTYMLINAVKEQQKMIEELRKEIEQLKSTK